MTGTVLADNSSQAGPLGLLMVALLGIAVVFLGRSMAKHLRRVPESFDPPASTEASTEASPSVSTDGDRPGEPDS